MTSRLDLPTRASAAPAARRHLAQVLRAWRLDSLAEPAELLVSELVTNAVKASGGGSERDSGGLPDRTRTIGLTLARTDAGLVIEVWDASPTAPAVSEQDPMAEGGRGLFLVETLSRAWGYHLAEAGGKVVWCEIGAL